MSKPCLPPEPDPAAPAFRLPDQATDCHMHVFGDPAEYPTVAERDYTPHATPIDTVQALYRRLGIGRFVVVQPSVYGSDNRCQLQLAAAIGLPFRAVAVPQAGMPDAEWMRLHDQGVRAIRYVLAHPGGTGTDDLERIADQARDLGWHLEFLLKPDQFVTLLPRLLALSCIVSIDHFGLLNPELGLNQPAFQGLLRLLDSKRGWAKLSGAYRVAGRAEQYGAVAPYAQMMVERHVDRLVWGSDWPHVGQMQAMPRTTPLLDLLTEWAPNEADRQRILVDNPAVLYDFPPV